ncbi:hypothetical protein Tco_0638932 [Tanacetum coccineum]
MRTRSQTRNRNRQQQSQPAVVQPFHLEEPFVNPPVVPMADNRTMAQLLQAPTEGYEDAIVIPEINANFELKHGLINLVQNKQFFGHDKEDPHAHIRYFNKITSTMRFPDIPSTSIKLMLFPFSLEDVAALTTEVSELKNMMKTMLIDKQKAQAPAPVKAVEQSCVTCGGAHSYRNCPTTDGNMYRDNIQEYVSQAAAANFNQGNTNSRPPMVSNQIRPPGFPPIQNNQNRFNQNQGNNFNQNRGTNFNQNRGNNFYQGQVYQPPTSQPPVYQAQPYQATAPQMQGVSKTDFENYVKANDAVLRNMQNQGQGLQNQMTNLTEMLSKFVNSNTASSSNSGSLPSNTVTNPKEDLKGITTRSGIVYQGQVYQPPTSQPPVYQAQPYQATAPQMQGVSKTDFENYVKANDAILRNMQNQGQGLQNQMKNLTKMLSKLVNSNAASSSNSGSLPSNMVTNPKEDLKGITTRSGIVYQGPTIPTTSSPRVVERRTEVIKDTVFPNNNGITEDVQTLVVPVENQNPVSEPDVAPVSAPMPNPKPSIPYPSRRNDESRRENADEQKREILRNLQRYEFQN